jgi:hypothetical protein
VGDKCLDELAVSTKLDEICPGYIVPRVFRTEQVQDALNEIRGFTHVLYSRLPRTVYKSLVSAGKNR